MKRKKRKKKIVGIGCVSVLVLLAVFFNQWLEIIAFHPFFGSDEHDLKVMTWNVHCPHGADTEQQKAIARQILEEDADIVQLNEFYQDSCMMIDSMLRVRYPYTEEYQSHRVCGDIYYSKKPISNSGHIWIPIEGRSIQTIKATIAVENDSVQIFGVHMASNSGDGDSGSLDSLKNVDSFYGRYKAAQEGRSFEAHWTKLKIVESKHPVIVMGDMNDFNCSAPLDTFATCGLRDSWWEGGTGYGCTFHDGWLRLRIDHIMYSPSLRESQGKLSSGTKVKNGLRLTSVKVIPTDLSDHNPVVATFNLN